MPTLTDGSALMSEEVNDAVKAAREAMELLKRESLTKEEKHCPVFHRHIGHTGSVNRLLYHIDERGSGHVNLKLPGQDEAAEVIHHRGNVVAIIPMASPSGSGCDYY